MLRYVFFTLLLVSGMLGSRARAGACELAQSNESLRALADAPAQAFFTTGDEEAFHASVRALQEGLPCLVEPITPSLAAQVHLALALDAFASGRSEEAVVLLHAAHTADPSFTLTVEQALPESQLRLVWEQAQALQLVDAAPLDVPQCTELYVDGRATTRWTSSAAGITQLRGPSGDVIWTQLVNAGQFPPPLEFNCVPDPLPAPAPPPKDPRALIAAATTSGVLAGALWGLSAYRSAQLEHGYEAIAAGQAVPYSRNEMLYSFPRQANTLGVAALGSGALALGLGITLLVKF